MGNGCDVLDRVDLNTGGGNPSHCGFAACSGSVYTHFHFLHSQCFRFLGGISCNHLGGISSTLSGTFEPVLTAGGPAEYVSVKVCKSHFCIVESSKDECDSGGDVTTAFLRFSAAAGAAVSAAGAATACSLISSAMFIQSLFIILVMLL